MAKRIVKLTESDLHRIVKRAIKESKSKQINEMENYFNPEAMETGDAILTIVGTTIAMLGLAGSHYIKAFIHKLREKGKDEEADEMQTALDNEMSKKSGNTEEMEETMMESRFIKRRKK